MRERAGTHGGLLQTGVDIACWLGQLTPCRHFDVGAFIDGSIDCAGLDDHHAAACRPDDSAVEHEPVASSAAGQLHATEVSTRLLLVRGARVARAI
jgi:hypothetical protein